MPPNTRASFWLEQWACGLRRYSTDEAVRHSVRQSGTPAQAQPHTAGSRRGRATMPNRDRHLP
jgi:hypothetical protein